MKCVEFYFFQPHDSLQQPQPVWGEYPGNSATNQVIATRSSHSCQWYGPSGILAGATNSTLIISNLSTANAGNYFIVVSNHNGQYLDAILGQPGCDSTATVQTDPSEFSESAPMPTPVWLLQSHAVFLGSGLELYKWAERMDQRHRFVYQRSHAGIHSPRWRPVRLSGTPGWRHHGSAHGTADPKKCWCCRTLWLSRNQATKTAFFLPNGYSVF